MSRLNRIKEQYKDLNVPLIDVLDKCDPSGNRKYLDFMLRMLLSEISNSDNMLENIANYLIGDENLKVLKEFHEHCLENRIKKSDIGSYNDWYSLYTVVDEANEIKKRNEAEKKIKRVYDENGWMVLIPLSLESAQAYGSGTKWCITQAEHWRTYHVDYKLIFIIDKNANKKYAVSVDVKYGDIKGWLADDTEINPILLDIPSEVMTVLISEIKIYESNYMLMGGDKKEETKRIDLSDWMDKYLNGYSFDFDINENGEITNRIATLRSSDADNHRITSYLDYLKSMY